MQSIRKFLSSYMKNSRVTLNSCKYSLPRYKDGGQHRNFGYVAKINWPAELRQLTGHKIYMYRTHVGTYSESVATVPPFSPIEGQKWFIQISSQWESQKNRFALIYFGKIQFLPPCIWNLPVMSTASGQVMRHIKVQLFVSSCNKMATYV
jgi:hypothetical protein